MSVNELDGPKRGVGSQAVFLAASTGLAQVLVALIYLVAARGSAPVDLGLTVAAIALGTSAAGFIDFGANSHWVREIARGRMSTAELGHRLTGKLSIATILGVTWTVVMATFSPEGELWMAGPVMIALMINQTSQVPLRGSARGELVAFSILVDRAVAVGVFFGLIMVGADSVKILWIALVVGDLSASVMGWLMAAKSSRPIPSINRRSNPWSGSGFFGLAGLANSVQSLDITLLSFVGGPAAAGLYGAVNRWTQPMTLLASAFSSAAAPFVARSENIAIAWRHLRKGIWMPIGAVLVSLCVFVFAPWAVPILLGDAYSGSAAVLRVLALVAIGSIVSQPALVVLQSLGRDRFVGFAMTAAVVIQLVLVGILGSLFGAIGAAWSSLSIQVLLALLFLGAIWFEQHNFAKGLRAASAESSRAGLGREIE